jgi:hypothetical protein
LNIIITSDTDNNAFTIIKTQKLYKDGEVTNYNLACSRLKGFIAAIKAEQFISQETEE